MYASHDTATIPLGSPNHTADVEFPLGHFFAGTDQSIVRNPWQAPNFAAVMGGWEIT